MTKRRYVTKEQRRQMRDYWRQGYTMCVFDSQDRMVPGYSDWALYDALKAMELLNARLDWADEDSDEWLQHNEIDR